jgi:transposase
VPTKPVVIVLDNGPVHVSKATAAALAARAHWLTVEWLPKYAPELNDIEVVWHDLKAFNLAHKTFTDVDTLDAAVHTAVVDLNTERNRDLLGNRESLLRRQAKITVTTLPAVGAPYSSIQDGTCRRGYRGHPSRHR